MPSLPWRVCVSRLDNVLTSDALLAAERGNYFARIVVNLAAPDGFESWEIDVAPEAVIDLGCIDPQEKTSC